VSAPDTPKVPRSGRYRPVIRTSEFIDDHEERDRHGAATPSFRFGRAIEDVTEFLDKLALPEPAQHSG